MFEEIILAPMMQEQMLWMNVAQVLSLYEVNWFPESAISLSIATNVDSVEFSCIDSNSEL